MQRWWNPNRDFIILITQQSPNSLATGGLVHSTWGTAGPQEAHGQRYKAQCSPYTEDRTILTGFFFPQ